MASRQSMLLRGLLDPSVIIVAIAGVYSLVRISEGERLTFFVVIAMTGIGATELLKGVRGAIAPVSRSRALVHVIAGLGALLVAYGVLERVLILPIAIGMLLLAGSGVLSTRPTNGQASKVA